MEAPEIKGCICGVNVLPHGDPGQNAKGERWIELLGEDDGNWFSRNHIFDARWLQDYIDVLQLALLRCKRERNGE